MNKTITIELTQQEVTLIAEAIRASWFPLDKQQAAYDLMTKLKVLIENNLK